MAEEQTTSLRPSTGEDEIAAELDEPPDHRIRFARIHPLVRPLPSKKSSIEHGRKESLLTKGLLTSPDLTPSSDAEAPFLTSDGGLTSPARTNSPSPRLPVSNTDFPTIVSHEFVGPGRKDQQKLQILHPTNNAADSSPATDLEVGLGRRRCIKFACGRQARVHSEETQKPKAAPAKVEASKPEDPPRRPCMLKFVCPMKSSSKSSENQEASSNVIANGHTESSSSTAKRSPSIPRLGSRQHRDSEATIKNVPMTGSPKGPDGNPAAKPLMFNRPDLEGSEATRFHEFAGPYNGEDEWVNEQTAYRKKITVNDTLEKENAIRKLAEEAEEEAMLEEDAEDETYDELEGLSGEDNASDGGNESDDEEGFAESDDESETGSEFSFWTPGLTTAATSADHLEHFHTTAPRTTSNSSIESMIHVRNTRNKSGHTAHRGRKALRIHPVRMRPGTPDLPDSTDFVCGTLDEDRPLEAAYMSCLEERRRSKHPVIPQDIDPSFPTSDPEADGDGETDGASALASDEPQWVMGRPDNSDDEQEMPRRKPLNRRNTKSPMPSPKRMRSPAPQKRGVARQHLPHVAASTDTGERSPSTSPSDMESCPRSKVQQPSPSPHTPTRLPKMMVPHLPHQAAFTRTASLPRTPNPFWAPCRQWSRLSSAATSPKGRVPDMRSRGPIDIVTGLEEKRQRRKEKFWRLHCRNGGKDKERRCQPGKGAERMRELGLEIAGKNKGQLPQPKLMLSI
ncbi:MAG: hypothetical protein LQ338_002425 [Usnochroma carphineum]|nr:MAG: hypothetical protein LQ338_002425 [Usnochroma carphineum]